MRLRELSLLAYGPFTGVSLNLSAPGLHVVYGRNEAGKSTALRAVKGLLFGIDAKTGDAHVHAMKDLRIGATLEDEGGHVLRVVRRKGTVNTLLDPQGKAIDDAPLERMLGGAFVELYEKMWGLDHASLRDGGEALALGQGDVGESLFGASLGGEVHEVLRSLRAEGDTLFAAAPNATRPSLNAALRAFADAQKRVRALSDSQGILVQQQGLDDALAERDTCEREKREASLEASRVKRARDVRPLLARRALLLARREALGDVPILPESATRDREEAERDRAEAGLRAARLEQEALALSQSRELVVVPAAIDREDVVDDVQHRLGGHRKAKDELSRVRVELAALEDEARALLGRMRRPTDLDRAEAAAVDPASQARIKKLAMQYAGLLARHTGAQRDLSSRAAVLEEKRALVSPAASSLDSGALRRAVSRAQPHGDIGERVRRAAVEAKKKEDSARALLAALGLFSGSLEAARELALPPVATVERFAERASRAERAAAKLEEQREETARRASQAARELDTLKRAGEVPTEEGLSAARARRDDAWRALRAGWDEAAAARFEGALAEADGVADRLRREADRVARAAALEAERAACAAEEARAGRAAAELRTERGTLDGEWRGAWRAAGIDPLPPAEMRAWLERHEKLRAAVEALRAAELEHERLAAEARDLAAALRDALEQAGDGDRQDDDVAALVARAVERGRVIDDAARARVDAERAAEALAHDVAQARREADDSAAAMGAWREAWAREVAAVGLSAEATPEEATTIADDLAELSRVVSEARRTRRRAAAMEADLAAFAEAVFELARAHAPDLASLPVEQAAAALVKRHQQSRDARAEQHRLDVLLDERRAALAEQRDRQALAEARLAAMMKTARAPDTSALERAERTSAEAREIDAQLRTVDERLAELGQVGDADEVIAGLSGMDMEALEGRGEELAARLEELDQRHRALERTIGGLEKGLHDIRQESAAAQAAAEAQEHLARVRASAERYARVRVAELLLAREIERYRERHQAPVLARAAALFARMTLGAFSGVRVGYGDDDQPVLRCVRAAPLAPGGVVEADVATLSDGTRDQLYLALRLSTLERYAETSSPLPLVVDDILVHFDDERARAALEVLGEVSQRMQILLFTHHARVVELAREATRGAVHVHTLAGGATVAAATPS